MLSWKIFWGINRYFWNDKYFLKEVIEDIGIKRNLDIELPHGIAVSKREDDFKEYFFIQNYSDEEREVNLEDYTFTDIVNNKEIIDVLSLKPYEVLILEKQK